MHPVYSYHIAVESEREGRGGERGRGGEGGEGEGGERLERKRKKRREEKGRRRYAFMVQAEAHTVEPL